ncbi:MAG: hypothetical protein ACRYGI_00535 [Janthinobacterium lividum]
MLLADHMFHGGTERCADIAMRDQYEADHVADPAKIVLADTARIDLSSNNDA